MIKINSKVQDILKSAIFNAISCLCSILIYLVILHSMAFNKNDATLHQNGQSKQQISFYFKMILIGVSLCIVDITLSPTIQAFSNGLKILYSQLCASINQQKQTNNRLLYQSILFCSCLTFTLLIFISFTFDYFLRLLNYDEDVIQVTKIGIIYLYISRILLIVYEFTRSQLQGLKIFGPFAIIQSISFGITTFVCFLLQIYYNVGIHQAGMLIILHEILKVSLLIIYIQKNKQNQQNIHEAQDQLLQNEEDNSKPYQQVNKIQDNILEQNQTMISLLLYIKPLLITQYIEFTFFNATIILSGRYSKDYIVPAVCFQMTNNLTFQGVFGLVESAVSFCGTTLASRDFEGTKEYFKYTLILLLSYEFIVISSLILFSEQWARCFSLEPEIIANIHVYKYLFLITVPLDGIQILYASFLQVCEIKDFVTKISLLSYISIGIPLMFILGDLFELQLGGIWLAIGISNSINLVFYIKKIQIIDYEEQYKLVIQNQELNCEKSLENQNSMELCQINKT